MTPLRMKNLRSGYNLTCYYGYMLYAFCVLSENPAYAAAHHNDVPAVFGGNYPLDAGTVPRGTNVVVPRTFSHADVDCAVATNDAYTAADGSADLPGSADSLPT